MSEQQSAQQIEKNSDGCADVIATLAVIAIVVGTVVFWLKSMV